jgi:hypothetical protein
MLIDAEGAPDAAALRGTRHCKDRPGIALWSASELT